MMSFTFLLLSAGLIALGAALWRHSSSQDAYKVASFCLWIGAYACIANAPVFSLSIEPEMATLGNNLGLYVGFPMMALVLLDLALGWEWQKATWGRIFLGLAATFELMRRAESGNSYGEFLLIGCTLALLVAFFKIIKNAIASGQAFKKHLIVLGFYFGLMVASLWSINTTFALLWNSLTLLTFGGYLYFAA